MLPCWCRKWMPGRRESLTLTVKTPRLLSHLRPPPLPDAPQTSHPRCLPPHGVHSQHHPCNYTHPPSETACLADAENINHVCPVHVSSSLLLFSSVTSSEYPLLRLLLLRNARREAWKFLCVRGIDGSCLFRGKNCRASKENFFFKKTLQGL